MPKYDDHIEQNLNEDVPATSTVNVANPTLPIGDTPKKLKYKDQNEKDGTPKVIKFKEWINRDK